MQQYDIVVLLRFRVSSSLAAHATGVLAVKITRNSPHTENEMSEQNRKFKRDSIDFIRVPFILLIRTGTQIALN